MTAPGSGAAALMMELARQARLLCLCTPTWALAACFPRLTAPVFGAPQGNALSAERADLERRLRLRGEELQLAEGVTTTLREQLKARPPRAGRAAAPRGSRRRAEAPRGAPPRCLSGRRAQAQPPPAAAAMRLLRCAALTWLRAGGAGAARRRGRAVAQPGGSRGQPRRCAGGGRLSVTRRAPVAAGRLASAARLRWRSPRRRGRTRRDCRCGAARRRAPTALGKRRRRTATDDSATDGLASGPHAPCGASSGLI